MHTQMICSICPVLVPFKDTVHLLFAPYSFLRLSSCFNDNLSGVGVRRKQVSSCGISPLAGVVVSCNIVQSWCADDVPLFDTL